MESSRLHLSEPADILAGDSRPAMPPDQWRKADDPPGLTGPQHEAVQRTGPAPEVVSPPPRKLLAGEAKGPWSRAEDRLLQRLPCDVTFRYIRRPVWDIDQRRRKLRLVESRRDRLGP